MICIQERNVSELNCMLPKFLPKCLLPLKVQKSGCPDPQCRVLVPNVPLNLHLSLASWSLMHASSLSQFTAGHPLLSNMGAILHLPVPGSVVHTYCISPPSLQNGSPHHPSRRLHWAQPAPPLIVHLLTPSSHILHPHASPACFPIGRKYDALRCTCA